MVRPKTGSEILQEVLNKAKSPSEMMKELEEKKPSLDSKIREIVIERKG